MKWNIVVGSLVIGASLSSQSYGGDLLNRLLAGKGCGATSSCCDTVVADPSCGVEIAPCGSKVDPSCGVEIAPCHVAPAIPSCGVEIASCDPCNTTVCCEVRTPVLDALKGLKGNLKCKLVGLKSKLKSKCATACDPCATAPTCGVEIASCDPCNAAPTCGVEIAACDPCGVSACDNPCGFKKPGLLNKIFAKKHHRGLGLGCHTACDTGCDAAPVGCNSCSSSAPVAAPAIEAAPEAAPAAVADPHAYLNTKRHVIQASSTRIR